MTTKLSRHSEVSIRSWFIVAILRRRDNATCLQFHSALNPELIAHLTATQEKVLSWPRDGKRIQVEGDLLALFDHGLDDELTWLSRSSKLRTLWHYYQLVGRSNCCLMGTA